MSLRNVIHVELNSADRECCFKLRLRVDSFERKHRESSGLVITEIPNYGGEVLWNFGEEGGVNGRGFPKLNKCEVTYTRKFISTTTPPNNSTTPPTK